MLKPAMLALTLLGVCAPPAHAEAAEPGVRLAYGDLALGTAAGRAALLARIDAAAISYCRTRSRDVLPTVSRNHRPQCLAQVRAVLIAEMPREAQRAYRTAERETAPGHQRWARR